MADERLEPLTDDDIENIASTSVSDAVQFMDEEYTEERLKSQEYMNGECDVPHDEGRTGFVVTVARNTVRKVKPKLTKYFYNSEKPAEFVPSTEDEVGMAEQATRYCQYVFKRKINGYKVLYNAIHDALTQNAAIVKAFWDEKVSQKSITLRQQTDMELQFLMEDSRAEIVEHEQYEDEVDDGMGGVAVVKLNDVKIEYTETSGGVCSKSIPIERFFVDSAATGLDDFNCIGHWDEMRVSDLVAMGFDVEEILPLANTQSHQEYGEEVEYTRKGFDDDYYDHGDTDPSRLIVSVAEAYMWMDMDGRGISKLYKFMLGGENWRKVLSWEEWDEQPFSIFQIDPEPHRFFGRSLIEILKPDQDVITSVVRGILDNTVLVNNPRTFVQTDMLREPEQMLNNELGAVVETDGPPRDTVYNEEVPFIAHQLIPLLEKLDRVSEDKSGVMEFTSGLSQDTLQSTTQQAIASMNDAQMGTIEIMARNLAETGLKPLFRQILKLTIENVPDGEMAQVAGDGGWEAISPKSWNANMDVDVNVGLGTGRENEKAQALGALLDFQLNAIQQGGMQNGMVGMTNVRNTMADLLALHGVRNTTRYLMPMDEEKEQQLIQQQAEAAANEVNPMIEAEKIRAGAKVQSDNTSAIVDALKATMNDDRERDRMDQDVIIKAAEMLHEYGMQLDIEKIRRVQSEPRDNSGNGGGA